MREEQAKGRIKLNGKEVEALFDTGASRSVIPKDLALELGCYRELPDRQKFELETAKKGVKIKITGRCDVIPEVAGCEIPSTAFEVSEDVREVIVGRPQLDEWSIEFVPEPRPKKCPITLEII